VGLYAEAMTKGLVRYQQAGDLPEHVHLLVSEPPNGLLANAIRSLKLSVTLRRRERPFWQARYYDFNVFSAKKRIEKLKYIHRNPVTRGLVAKPEDWAWSSFTHYATGARGVVNIESQWAATRRERTVIVEPTSENPDVGHPLSSK
jgi:putative transposase